MIKSHIKVSKTARYFLSQTPHKKINQVWIVFHGYGQLADSLLKYFEPVFAKDTLVIAPEGLHRFYWNGFNGKVSASWMTKEDRLSDIDDYINYLDELMNEIKPKINPSAFYHVLGFSQGAATVSRWATLGKNKFQSLTLWAGTFPDDIDYVKYLKFLNALNLKVFIGTQDQFFDEEIVVKEINKLKTKGLKFKIIRFIGGHKIEESALSELQMLIKKEINSNKQLF